MAAIMIWNGKSKITGDDGLLSLRKKIAIFVCLFMGFVFLLISAGAFYLETESARIMIQKRINAKISGSLSWEKMTLSPFVGSLVLEDFHVNGPDKKQVIGLKKIKINISWLRFLKAEFFISSLLLESPRIDIQTGNDGSINIISALKPPGEGPQKEGSNFGGFSLNIIVDRLVLKDGAVLYSHPGDEISAHLKGITVLIRQFNLAQRKLYLDVRLKESVVGNSEISIDLDEFKTSATLIDGTISPLSLDLVSNAITIGINGSVNQIFKDPELAITLDSMVNLPKAAKLLHVKQNPEGSVKLALSAKGKLEDPVVDLSVKYGGGTISGHHINSIDLGFLLKDRLVKILPSVLDASVGKFAFNGIIDLQNAFPKGFLDQTRDFDAISYFLSMKQDGADNFRFLPDKEGISGDLATHFTLEGQGVDPEKIKADLILDIHATDLKQGTFDRPVDVRITTRANMADKKVTLETLTATSQGMVLNATGAFEPGTKKIDGRVDLKADDMSPALGLFNIKAFGGGTLSATVSGQVDRPEILLDAAFENLGLNSVSIGTLNISATAKGTIGNPSARITLVGKAMAMGSNTFGNVDTKANYEKGVLTIDHFKVRNKQSGLDINGSLKLPAPGTTTLLASPDMDIAIQGESIYLEDFFDPMKGRFSVNGQISGNLETLAGTLDVDGSMIDLGVQKIEKVTLNTSFEGQTVVVKKIEIKVSPQAALKGNGWFAINDNRFQIDLITKHFPLSVIEKLDSNELTGGLLDLSLSGQGTLENPLVTGKLSIRDLSVNEEKMTPIDLDFDVNNQVAKIKGTLGFKLDGEYHLKDRSFGATVGMESVTLSPYFKFVGQHNFSGQISGAITAKGTIDHWERLNATADISRLLIRFKDHEFIRIPRSSLSIENGFFDIKETDIKLLDQGMITLKGRGELNGSLEITINGDIPLDVINPIVEDIDEAIGNVKIAASIQGSVAKPMIYADLTLDQLGMSLSAIEQKLKQVNGHIRISPEEIVITRFDGKLGGGEFELNGHAVLSGFSPETFDLNVNARQLSLDFPDLMDLSFNGSLTLLGTKEKSNLTGEIVLLEGRYYKDVNLNLASAAKRKRGIEPILDKKNIPILEAMSLDIDIKRREPLWVDNNLALLSISPDLNIYGTAAAPLIGGRAQVDSGTIMFRKNEFEVKKGIIDFINPYKIEPTIDIDGEMEVRAWTIYLTVSGTPDNLDFNFNSKPDEQDVDILSLLAFGKTTRELRTTDGGSSFSPGEILASFVAETLQEQMKDASGMDYLGIKLDDTNNSGEQGLNVTVGKELSRQVTVKYGVDIRNGETVQRVTTDYKLLENLLMSGFQDTGGDFGGELKYRLEFR